MDNDLTTGWSSCSLAPQLGSRVPPSLGWRSIAHLRSKIRATHWATNPSPWSIIRVLYLMTFRTSMLESTNKTKIFSTTSCHKKLPQLTKSLVCQRKAGQKLCDKNLGQVTMANVQSSTLHPTSSLRITLPFWLKMILTPWSKRKSASYRLLLRKSSWKEKCHWCGLSSSSDSTQSEAEWWLTKVAGLPPSNLKSANLMFL